MIEPEDAVRTPHKLTCREKLKLEHPNAVDTALVGGCAGCPNDWGYAPKPDECGSEDGRFISCTQCWDREVEEPNDTQEPTCGGEECQSTDQPVIKDSGNRRQFDTGAVRDIQEGKGRCDLMPLEVVARILGGHYSEAPRSVDPVMYTIAQFQDNGDTSALYFAIDYFAGRAFTSDDTISNKKANMLLGVSKHFEEGAKKYGENNWQKGIPVNCYIDSAVRHYLKWLRGDKDEPHDRAFVWNLMCCIWEVDCHEKAD